jgi:hypothetical protein
MYKEFTDVDDIQKMIHNSDECFLQYLDNYFKPEIDLSNNEPDEIFTEEPSKPVTNRKTSVEVNLRYKGQKNTFEKGKFAERRDVLYKTLFRSARRYLLEAFSNEFKPVKSSKKALDSFLASLNSYYSTHMKPLTQSIPDYDENLEDKTKATLGMLITLKACGKDDIKSQRKLVSLIKKAMKAFSIST